jgi:hypothetical protein
MVLLIGQHFVEIIQTNSTPSTNPHATKAANNNFQNTNGGGGVIYGHTQR